MKFIFVYVTWRLPFETNTAALGSLSCSLRRYPNTARVYLKGFTGNADMPYDFFMSRYKEVRTTDCANVTRYIDL